MDVVFEEGFHEVEAEPGVYLAQLAAGDRMSIQHLRMEPGSRIPAHSHPHEQAGFVYEGAQTFLLDEDTIVVGPGESYRIEGEEVHAVENRSEEELRAIDVFSPPRLNPDWAE